MQTVSHTDLTYTSYCQWGSIRTNAVSKVLSHRTMEANYDKAEKLTASHPADQSEEGGS
jgi:hypothetical protein